MNKRWAQVIRTPASSRTFRNAVSRVLRGRPWGVRSSRIDGKRYLDIGCGQRTHPEFINLDYTWWPGVDICWDVTKGIPLPSASMRGIYSEHCVEHLELDQADALFAEMFRLLAPGGTLRVIVPDGELYARRYVEHIDGTGNEPFPHEDVDGIHGIRTPMMSVNRIFTQWGHRFIYDYETLEKLLAYHGFVEIRRQSFRAGHDPAMLHDDDYHVLESLYVEARRPQAADQHD
jgi:predicted SAM-dependent methyltransferase